MVFPFVSIELSHGETTHFGTARVNITPALPIRLSGYAARSTEATNVTQDLYATAAAFGTGAEKAILIAVECTGIPKNVADVVSESLSQRLGVSRDRVSITSTHTHNGPCIHGYLDDLFIFGTPLSPAEQQRVEQYTAILTDKLEEVALDALANSTPGHTIAWGTGSVGFGANRRGGSVVDHDLPVMRVTDSVGDTKSIITSYAAHAVTLSSNSVGGDWPGYAREAIETLYPGATALVLIGAAADINPNVLGSTAAAQNQGQQIADEVARLINDSLMFPVGTTINATHGEIDLAFATALEPGDPSNARLAPVGTPDHQYGISTWTFGDEIAMVFLEGEVVVDYSLRLKAEYNDGRMWVNGYSNDVPGYIPSERILFEGGYEADSSGLYYGMPGRFAHGIEDKIINEVLRQLDPFFNPQDRLRLVIDQSTGALTILNAWQEPIEFDAYTIESAEGNLSGSWNSLADQGIPGWDEADNSSHYRLTEFNPVGSLSLLTNDSLQLGSPLVLPVPSRFGEEYSDVMLTFQYSTPDKGTIKGRVDFVVDRHNNLVLTIDPEAGAAAIQNDSPYYGAEIEGYTIASVSGLLLTDDHHWNSLADQGLPGWDEAANVDAFRITEFNPIASTLLDVGSDALYLGEILDVSGGGISPDDLEFEFLLTSGEILRGVIVIGHLPGGPLLGDFDLDGLVDGHDLLAWQRDQALGSLSDWEMNFGITGSFGTATGLAVPEPASRWLLVAIGAVTLFSREWSHLTSRQGRLFQTRARGMV